MWWACYWYGKCRNAYRLFMGKLVANVHMAGHKGERRMMLRWVLDRAYAWEVNVLLRIGLVVGFDISTVECSLLVTLCSIQNVI